MKIQSLFGFILCFGLTTSLQAQFYYSDLLGLKQTEQQQQLYRSLRVKQVRSTAIQPSGEAQSGFQESIEIVPTGDTVQRTQLLEGVPATTMLVYAPTGRLLQQHENRSGYKSQISYYYMPTGQVDRLENRITDSLSDFHNREIHHWEYDSKGNPQQMWRILEKSENEWDTTEIRLVTDSSGLVTEERSFKKGRETGFYYYYYNEQRQLTDIVRYHERFKRLLPDQLFEYDEQGRQTQRMLLTGNQVATYLIWRYGYRTDGLLSEEALFNNKKEYTGSIRYSYSFYEKP